MTGVHNVVVVVFYLSEDFKILKLIFISKQIPSALRENYYWLILAG